jgi:hypothetical protein
MKVRIVAYKFLGLITCYKKNFFKFNKMQQKLAPIHYYYISIQVSRIQDKEGRGDCGRIHLCSLVEVGYSCPFEVSILCAHLLETLFVHNLPLFINIHGYY